MSARLLFVGLVLLGALGCADEAVEEAHTTQAISLDALPRPVVDFAIPGTARGCLGGYEHGRLWGWAQVVGDAEPVHVRIEVDGVPRAHVLAEAPRADLEAKGLHPTGRAGFTTVLEALSPGAELTAFVEGSDVALHGGPCTVDESGGSDCTAGRARGRLGGYADGQVWGWAQIVGRGEPVHVEIAVDGELIHTVVADDERPDLLAKRLHPTGYAGFRAPVGQLPPGSSIDAVIAETDTPLRGGPLVTVDRQADRPRELLRPAPPLRHSPVE